MSQVELAYAERIDTEGGGTSATYATAPTPQLASSSFVPGKKYLILARAELGFDVAGSTGGFRLMHGSTAFVGGECIYTTASPGVNDKILYHYMGVWTAVSGEALTFQFKSDGTNNMKYRFVTLLAIRLSDTLTENTDWYFNESTTNTTLTTTGQTGGTITFTPGTAGQRWLVITDAALEQDATADQFVSRLDETGGATASWDAIYGGRASGNIRQLPHIWHGTLGAVSQTFREQARRIGTTAATARRLRSAVFALNLSKLDAVGQAFNDAQLDAAGTANIDAFDQLALSAAHSQLVDGGNVLVIGYMDFSNTTDAVVRSYAARVQQDGVDAYSTDGVTNTYTDLPSTPRFNTPSASSGQSFPYVHYSLEQMAAGSVSLDMDFQVNNLSAKGVRFRRILALSLDVTPPSPPAGAGGTPVVETTEQLMYLLDPVAVRRRAMVRLVDATDNVTPETTEAGGQPAISVNGGTFTTAGVGTLNAHDAPNGLYWFDPGQTNLSDIGSLRIRYKSAATALFTAVLAIEPLPALYQGKASGGGANYVDLTSGPAALQPGSIVRIVGGTGNGQSMLALSYNSGTGRVTMEGNWSDSGGVAPDTTSTVLIEPGLPFVVADANVTAVAGSSTAATGLKEGAEAVQAYVIRTGANGPTQLITSLPTVVNTVATGPNFWAGRSIIMKDGPLAGDQAFILASAVSGADTVLTLDSSAPLTGTPAVGNKFVLV